MIRRITLLAILIALGPVAGAQAPVDGFVLMREANALARDGLYRVALLRYREAAAAGVDSPLFHYNLGIVQYRLNDFAAAVSSLVRATSDTELAPLARYNIGLAQIALGDEAAALSAFEQVVDMGAGRELRRLARRASASLVDDRASASASTVRERSAVSGRGESDDGIPGFNVLLRAQYGQADNVYRAPSEAYVDLSLPGQPTIAPIVYAASMMPVDLLVEYAITNEAQDSEFQFQYLLNGEYYDKEFANADRVHQRVSLGAHTELDAQSGNRRILNSSIFMSRHHEKNFNPDDGLDRSLGDLDLGDRFNYRGAGIELEYAHGMGRWSYGFDALLERRHFDNEPLLTNYDHEFYFGSLWTELALNSNTRLRVGLEQFRRVYDERVARDLAGALLITNPSLEYVYQAYQLGIERQLGQRFEIEFGVERLQRTDQFLGYNDYTRDGVEMVLTLSPGARMDISAKFDVGSYEYPSAFAFNDPAGGIRETKSSEFELRLEYAFTSRISLWASMEIEEVVSSDFRAEYERSIATLGVLWRRR
jgi:hypothetical protein